MSEGSSGEHSPKRIASRLKLATPPLVPDTEDDKLIDNTSFIRSLHDYSNRVNRIREVSGGLFVVIGLGSCFLSIFTKEMVIILLLVIGVSLVALGLFICPPLTLAKIFHR